MAELRQKWIDRGGEFVTLSPAEQAEFEKRLKPIGAEVTKDDPVLKAFYDKIQSIEAKYPKPPLPRCRTKRAPSRQRQIEEFVFITIPHVLSARCS